MRCIQGKGSICYWVLLLNLYQLLPLSMREIVLIYFKCTINKRLVLLFYIAHSYNTVNSTCSYLMKAFIFTRTLSTGTWSIFYTAAVDMNSDRHHRWTEKEERKKHQPTTETDWQQIGQRHHVWSHRASVKENLGVFWGVMWVLRPPLFWCSDG